MKVDDNGVPALWHVSDNRLIIKASPHSGVTLGRPRHVSHSECIICCEFKFTLSACVQHPHILIWTPAVHEALNSRLWTLIWRFKRKERQSRIWVLVLMMLRRCSDLMKLDVFVSAIVYRQASLASSLGAERTRRCWTATKTNPQVTHLCTHAYAHSLQEEKNSL